MGFQPRPGMDLAAALKGKLPKQAEAYDPRTQMPLHDPAAMRRAKLDPSAPPSFFFSKILEGVDGGLKGGAKVQRMAAGGCPLLEIHLGRRLPSLGHLQPSTPRSPQGVVGMLRDF